MRKLWMALVLGLAAAACGDDPVAPPGVVRLQFTMTGVDRDDGYSIRAGGATHRTTGSDTVVLEGLRPGTHQVTFVGIASNCTPIGGTTRSVVVTAGQTTQMDVVVTCVAVTGAIAITTSTTGAQIDPDGFVVQLNSAPPQPIGVNETRVIEFLPPGDHTVTLSGLAPNCTLTGANPRIVRVSVGGVVRDTARAVFAVTCAFTPGDVRVVVQTTGADLDPDGYSVTVDDYGPVIASPPTNGSVTVTGIASGPYDFLLGGVAANCTVVAPNPRRATVVAGSTIEVAFSVTCAGLTRVDVTTATTGVDLDRNGYGIRASGPSGSTVTAVAANGTVTIPLLSSDAHTLTLIDLAANCDAVGGDTRTVVAGEPQRVSFTVTCATLGRIAYALLAGENFDIYTSKADGSSVSRLTEQPGYDGAPAWARTGRIAFRSHRNAMTDIYSMAETGSDVTRLTTGAAEEYSPTWSPDGTRIAFVSDRDGNPEIYVMNADGSGVLRLTNDVAFDSDPAWSPDGTRIAFARTLCQPTGCDTDIHLINPDGQALQRLANTGNDAEPAWSPDGTQIAFSRVGACGYYSCERDIGVMSASGANPRIIAGTGLDESEPAWSPSGSRLLIAVGTCDYYSCTPSELRLIRPDGRDPVTIVSGYAVNPVWRP